VEREHSEHVLNSPHLVARPYRRSRVLGPASRLRSSALRLSSIGYLSLKDLQRVRGGSITEDPFTGSYMKFLKDPV
jgi:hypothetical protein